MWHIERQTNDERLQPGKTYSLVKMKFRRDKKTKEQANKIPAEAQSSRIIRTIRLNLANLEQSG